MKVSSSLPNERTTMRVEHNSTQLFCGARMCDNATSGIMEVNACDNDESTINGIMRIEAQ